MSNSYLQMSATELTHLIATKQISVYEVVLAHIEQASRVNRSLNAIVIPHYDAALRRARALDRSTTIDLTQQPLFGIPFTVKESIAVQGWPNTYGSYYRRNDIAARNATAVQRLLSAGAIILGQSNLSEFALWPECANMVYGKTRNPHNLTYSSGGSSGGDAAIVSAGGVPFALGTDGGGSVRIPAAHCGVVGHKPSSQYVPMSGHFPLDSYYSDHAAAQFIARFFSMGLLCRTAQDLLPLLQVISGPDRYDSNVNYRFDPQSLSPSLTGLKIYLAEGKVHPLAKKASPEVIASLRHVAATLAKTGAEIIPWDCTQLSEACALWFDIIATAPEITLNAVVNGNRSVWLELLRMVVGRKRVMLSTLLQLLIEKLSGKPAKNYQQFWALHQRLIAQLNVLLTPNSVLLLPTFPTTAIKANRSYLSPFDFLYTAIFNVLELPATSIPVAWSAQQLPIAVQIVGRHGGDPLLIAIACYLEKELGTSRYRPTFQ